MSERGDGSGREAGPGRPVPMRAVQPGLVPGAPLGLAVASSAGLASVAPVPGGPGRAAAVVGIVLAEAIALYVGYGVLTRAVDPAFHRLFASD